MAYMHGCWAWSADVVVRWSAVVLMLERGARALGWGGTHALCYLVAKPQPQNWAEFARSYIAVEPSE